MSKKKVLPETSIDTGQLPHVLPETSTDDRMHVLDETCWCEPKVEVDVGGWLGSVLRHG